MIACRIEQFMLGKKEKYFAFKFAIVIIILFCFAKHSFANPAISWSPNQLEFNISQGEKKSVNMSISSDADLSNVEVWPTPELQPYIYISSAIFSTIKKNIPFNITLIFSIPSNTSITTSRSSSFFHLTNNYT